MIINRIWFIREAFSAIKLLLNITIRSVFGIKVRSVKSSEKQFSKCVHKDFSIWLSKSKWKGVSSSKLQSEQREGASNPKKKTILFKKRILFKIPAKMW